MVSRQLLLHKLRALAVSLGVFALFAAGLGLLARFWLYPDYLFWLEGGFQGLLLVLAVDLVLGPLMVFIVYNPAKPRRELRTDISLLAILQFTAMGWGVYQTWEPRPVAVVYGDHRFVAINDGNIELQGKKGKDLRGFSTQYPPLIYRREPRGQEERAQFVGMMFKRAIFAEAQVWLYEPFEANRARVFAQGAEVLRHVESTLGEEWKDWLAAQDDPSVSAYELAFFQGRYGDAVLIFAKGGDYLDYLALPGKMPVGGVRVPAPAVSSASGS